ncbi:MAG TPA: 50S ribosomal protein L14e [Methanofastidiosum sp.]|nr:50S ribosomal protein L14e [Methanofastidiosum sp.]HNZ87819.1 50S ribosomal protein L14e [Methanofastidiosum sp.]HOC78203.1 50S ribosomal protein L14e [Methanofastidiosum sp.]HOG74041.1 50S ribosomal protein L14e [Methanofastidiosum sp.]HPA49518.1 50S ribosomal protein L14e [Methanofastidiosum sp.]
MMAMEIGRVCTKLLGREADKNCVIVDIVNKNFVVVSGPKEITGVKRRRCNIKHLEPWDVKVNVEKGASDETLKQAIQKAKVEGYS